MRQTAAPQSCVHLKQQHRQRLCLGFGFEMQDCWLEVTLHPARPETGLLDQDFRGFPLSLRKC
jgi:hypothetical protein